MFSLLLKELIFEIYASGLIYPVQLLFKRNRVYNFIFSNRVLDPLSSTLFTERGDSIGCASAWYADGRGFDPHVRQHSFLEICHPIISMAILSLPLIQEGQLSVTDERMFT